MTNILKQYNPSTGGRRQSIPLAQLSTAQGNKVFPCFLKHREVLSTSLDLKQCTPLCFFTAAYSKCLGMVHVLQFGSKPDCCTYVGMQYFSTIFFFPVFLAENAQIPLPRLCDNHMSARMNPRVCSKAKSLRKKTTILLL